MTRMHSSHIWSSAPEILEQVYRRSRLSVCLSVGTTSLGKRCFMLSDNAISSRETHRVGRRRFLGRCHSSRESVVYFNLLYGCCFCETPR